MPRIAVYLRNEDPAQALASHSSSQALWACIVANRAGKNIDKTHGQLTTGETWRQVKDRLRPSAQAKVATAQALEGYTQQALDMDYPHRGQETVRHPHEALRRACVSARAHNKKTGA
jgi:hypothetical protein